MRTKKNTVEPTIFRNAYVDGIPLTVQICPVCGGGVSVHDDALYECNGCHELLYRHELVYKKTTKTRRAYALSNGHDAGYGKRKGNR